MEFGSFSLSLGSSTLHRNAADLELPAPGLGTTLDSKAAALQAAMFSLDKTAARQAKRAALLDVPM